MTSLLITGCASLQWSWQAVEGHFDLLARREPMTELIADPHTPPDLRRKLELALMLRDYASTELALPDNDSYRSYADLQRSAVVWNVVAAPAYSLQPHTWCYPLAGCLAYRGWYRRDAARQQAGKLHADALDVLVSPALAYSTLGWFDDPVLNTMLAYPEAYLAPVLADLIFHELAHQQLFVAGDTAFNEAFAVAVAGEGVRRWLAQRDDPELTARWQAWQQARLTANRLLTGARKRLEYAYRYAADEEHALRAKQQIFLDLRRWYLDELRSLREQAGPDDPDYRALRAWNEWFAQPLNNANLALHATYQEGTRAFEQLLKCLDHDLPAFYRAAAGIGDWPQQQRRAWLQNAVPMPAGVCAGV